MMIASNAFLEEIVRSKSKIVNDKVSEDQDLSHIMEMAREARPPFDFHHAISNREHLSLIAEIKRASPSKGIMRPDLDPASQASAYQGFGASALSVLTEEEHFHGSLQDLTRARAACTIPILRKDFIIHPYQVYEARAYGADAVLLIAAILSKQDLLRLVDLTRELGMHPLLEVHSQEEIPKALGSGAQIIGINNRDLTTFRVDIETTEQLARFIPKDCLLVSESGIKGVREAKKVSSWGARAILVGEALVTSENLEALIRDLSQIPLVCP
ncbi:MAG: indole-3-glycerol phosphate synthase TrpC [bacterium]